MNFFLKIEKSNKSQDIKGYNVLKIIIHFNRIFVYLVCRHLCVKMIESFVYGTMDQICVCNFYVSLL